MEPLAIVAYYCSLIVMHIWFSNLDRKLSTLLHITGHAVLSGHSRSGVRYGLINLCPTNLLLLPAKQTVRYTPSSHCSKTQQNSNQLDPAELCQLTHSLMEYHVSCVMCRKTRYVSSFLEWLWPQMPGWQHSNSHNKATDLWFFTRPTQHIFSNDQLTHILRYTVRMTMTLLIL